MLTRKRQQNYFNARLESVLLNCQLYSKRARAENIHRIRVDLKKIRALLYLQEKTGSAVNTRSLKYIRKIFKQAGKIRDAQVSAALMKKMQMGTPAFFSHQREIVAGESKVFNALVSRHTDKLMKACARQRKSFRHISRQEINKLNRFIVKKLKPVYFPRLKLTELHESRKSIKRMIYLNSILKEKDNSRIKIDCLRKLEESVGKWHDAIVTEKLVKQFSSGTRISPLLAAKKKKLQELIQAQALECF